LLIQTSGATIDAHYCGFLLWHQHKAAICYFGNRQYIPGF